VITFRTSAEITADRQVVLSLPPDTPIGPAEFVVTVAPQDNSCSPRGGLRRRFGTVRGGDPRFADNNRIDADLANAYGDSHE
jgi:hypothetical protein